SSTATTSRLGRTTRRPLSRTSGTTISGIPRTNQDSARPRRTTEPKKRAPHDEAPSLPRRANVAAMPLIEIRRHAERADPKNNQGSLSEAGRAMAETLAKRAPKFALVLSSPLPRAKETAQLIAGRLDAVDAGLLPEMGSVIGDRIFGDMQTLADWSGVLSERADARSFDGEQLQALAPIEGRVSVGGRV